MSVGQEIFIYAPDCKVPCWTKLIYKIPLQSREQDPRAGQSADKEPVHVVDISYSSIDSILCVLRSDICLEFFHITSMSKLCKETICPAGTWPVDMPYDRLATRNLPREPAILFAVGKTKIIDVWTMTLRLTGLVVLEERQPLVKHTDYVRDILVVHTDVYRLLITCGMDRKVIIWDLEDLSFKAKRCAHTAGVQCLAFNGKSVILGGGFDFSIVAWDLDAEIDRPLYKLTGHNSPVVKIVSIGSANICMSLDVNGELRYWHASTTRTDLIATFTSSEDHLRTFEIIKNLGQSFHTLHDLFVLAAGRRKHVLQLVDTSPIESPPLCSFYSSTLQLIIVIHQQDIKFWSAESGQIVQCKRTQQNNGGEMCLAVLDSREQKIVVADTKGVISTYNGLDGTCLTRFRPLPSQSLRYLFYSTDKTILCISLTGEIFVVDEFPSENDTDSYLRRLVIPENEIIACAFSSLLGLIAMVDINGTVTLWDYQYFSLELVVERCTGSGTSPGQLVFLEPFPLLLVTDNLGNFTIVILGAAAENRREIVWRVKAFHDEANKSTDENKSGGEDVDDATAEDMLFNDVSTGGRAKPFDAAKIKVYRRIQRFVKSISVHIVDEDNRDYGILRQDSLDSERSDDDVIIGLSSEISLSSTSTSQKTHDVFMNTNHSFDDNFMDDNRNYDSLRGSLVIGIPEQSEVAGYPSSPPLSPSRTVHSVTAKVPFSSLTPFTESIGAGSVPPSPAPVTPGVTRGPSSSPIFPKRSESQLSKRNYSSTNLSSNLSDLGKDSVAKPPVNFPSNTRVTLICGHDDGTIALYDITEVMKKIDVAPIKTNNTKQTTTKKLALSRNKITRNVTDAEIIKVSNKKKMLLARKRAVKCRLELVWAAHNGPILSLSVIGERKNILSTSDDGSVQLWSLQGLFLGVLTRGSEKDRLLHRHWRSPMDNKLREKIRRKQAEAVLSLIQVNDAQNSRSMYSLRRRSGMANSTADMKSIATSTMNSLANTDIELLPPRERAIGQLRGQVTYILSKQETAEAAAAKVHQHVMKTIHDIGKPKLKKKRRKRNSIVHDVTKISPDKIDSNFMATLNIQVSNQTSFINQKKYRTPYQAQIAAMQADDPDNWGITSTNTQRKMYKNMYAEKSRTGLDEDHSAIFHDRLNALSPDNNFSTFVEELKAGTAMERFYATYCKSELSSLTNTDNYNVDNINNNNNNNLDDKLNENEEVSKLDDLSQYNSSENSPMQKATGHDEISYATQVNIQSMANMYQVRLEGTNEASDMDHQQITVENIQHQNRGVNQTDHRHSNSHNKGHERGEDVLFPKQSSTPTKAVTVQSQKENTDDSHRHDIHSRRVGKKGLLTDDNYDGSDVIEEDTEHIIQRKAPFSHDPGRKDVTNTTVGNNSNDRRSMYSSSNDNSINNTSISKSRSAPNTIENSERRNRNIDYESTSIGSASSKSLQQKVEQRQPGFVESVTESSYLSTEESKSKTYRNTSAGGRRKTIVMVDAITANRKATESVLQRFESRLHMTEEASNRKKLKKQITSTYLQRNRDPKSPVVEEKLPGSTAEQLLRNQSTLSDMLQIGKKQMEAELNWVRKVKLAITEGKETVVRKNSTASVNGNNKSTKSRSSTNNALVHNINTRLIYGMVGKGRVSSHKLTQQELLARNAFGPYKASDIMKALLVFLALPAQTVEEDDVINSIQDNSDKNTPGDTTPTSKNAKLVLLADFIQTDFVQSRPHFDQELRKYMKKRTGRVGMVELKVTMTEIATNMCPLMTPTDLHDCIDYLNLQMKRQKAELHITTEDILSEDQLSQLRLIFDFFDKERTGRINRHEIMKLMESETNKFYAKQQAEFLEGGEVEEETHIEEERVDKMLASVELKNKHELDFDEFVTLFKNVV